MQILSELIEIGYRRTHLGHLVIDADLAEHVGFVLTWSTHYLGGCEDTIIRLTSPGGRVITSADTDIYEYKYNLRTITIDVSGYGVSSHLNKICLFLVCDIHKYLPDL